MSQNSYEGVLENWKVGLIVRRAARLGIKDENLEDAMQDLVIELMQYKFDVSRTNLSEESDLAIFVDHYLKNRLRSEKRRRVRDEAEAQHRERNKTDYQSEVNMQQEAEFCIVVEQLSPIDKEVFKYLRQGKSPTFIAAKLNVRWHTVERAVERIVEKLTFCKLIDPNYPRET